MSKGLNEDRNLVDEFNRPLGQPQEKEPSEKSVKQHGSNRWIAYAGLFLGLVAVGLFAFQMTFSTVPSKTVVSNSDTTENDPVASNTGESATGEQSAALSDQAETQESSGTGEPGLTELEPNGSIAVPKPRPPRAEPQEIGLAHLPDPDFVERGATGVIPRRSDDGRRPMDIYSREPDTSGNFGVARIVIIVGGIGVSQTASQNAIRKLPPSVTLAFAPSGNSLARWMQAARKKGHELLLQIPMEPFGFQQSSGNQRTLLSGDNDEENIANLHWAMSQITNYVGLMNYQGAKLLADEAALKPVFDEIAERGLLFVDDGSAGNNKSKIAAARSILPFASGHVQIDAKRSRRDIAEQLAALVAEAKRTGVAIGVANGFSDSIDMIAEFAAQAGKIGVEITPVSAIVNDPERDG